MSEALHRRHDPPPRRRRDPEARRQAIVDAAAELIVEVGVDAITHRMVAARADVPLGATTQYFDTLDDLRDAALGCLLQHVDARMEATRQALVARGSSARALAAVIHGALVDAQTMQTDRAVVTAAVHDPRLREIARDLSDRLAGFLVDEHGPERATAAAAFLDGVLWHSLVRDEPMPQPIIEMALAGIFGEQTAEAPATDPPRPARLNSPSA